MVMETRAWLGALAACLGVAVVSGGCGGGAERECQFNSNCAAGRYCTPAGTCVADCTPEGGECGAAADCNSFGMCVPRADAGAMPDAFSLPIDAFIARPDVGMDAYEIPDGGPPSEQCTASIPGRVPADEDMDGAVDEHCPWFFGPLHPVLPFQVSVGLTTMGHISADGLRAYVGAAVPVASGLGGATRAVYRVERPSTGEPFGAPVLVAGTSPSIQGFALSEDELTVYFDDESGPLLQVARRTSTSAPFGAPEPLADVNDPTSVNYGPALSRDGLELFFSRFASGVRTMWVARRPATSEAFSPPMQLVAPGVMVQDAIPRPDAQSTGVFFVRDNGIEWRVMYAPLTADGASLGEPVALPSLDGAPYSVVARVDQRHRELWLFSNRPTATGTYGLFRAEICRDGACPLRSIDCPAGTRDASGQHCYTREGAPATFAEGYLRCASSGGHLATVHSQPERDIVWGLRPAGGSGVFLGAYDGSGPEGGGVSLTAAPECRRTGAGAALGCGFRHTNGEPWLYQPWGVYMGELLDPNDPGAEDCAALFSGVARPGDLVDANCASVFGIVCEREQWPTW